MVAKPSVDLGWQPYESCVLAEGIAMIGSR